MLHRKRFETHAVRRVQVSMLDDLKAWFAASSPQGRQFPQALSEAFGRVEDVTYLQLGALEQVKQSVFCRLDIYCGEQLVCALSVPLTDLSRVARSGVPPVLAIDLAEKLVAQCKESLAWE